MKVRKINLLAVFVMVVMILAMPMTAHAESIYIESQGITVELKETPSKTVVVDKRGVLSDGQIKQIEAAGTKLKIYDIGLYVEMTEKATCSQDYANDLSERKFDELLNGKENSIMIVFSFYEDAGGYYAVHYDVQGDLRESSVNQIIQGTYHEFKTDATWITGSFEQVVDYLTDVEYNLINADEIAARRRANLIVVAKVFRVVFELLGVATIIYLYWEWKSTDKKWRTITDKKDKKIELLHEEARKKKATCKSLKKTCQNLQEWKSAAIASTPDVEKNIATLYAKECAQDFDDAFKDASSFEELVQMVSEYDEMSQEEKSYVKLDLGKARESVNKMAKDEAKKATKIITEACKEQGNRHSRETFSRTMNYYNGLPSCVKILIAAHIVRQLNDKHSAAQSDYKRYQSTHSSSYSHHSHTSSFHHSGGFHSGTFGGGFHGGH